MIAVIAVLPVIVAAASFFLSGSARNVQFLNRCGSLGLLAVISIVFIMVAQQGALHFGMLYVDQLSVLLLGVLGVLQFTACWVSGPYLKEDGLEAEETAKYYALMQLFIFTMLLVLVVENLGVMWVAVEATTLASALLVAFYVSRSALEAAWKYVMVCTVGICLALLGLMLLYYAQTALGGSGEDALSWLALRRDMSLLDPQIVKLALVFIVIGYGTKAGLAPMHTWLPDAHSQAPAPISGLLSGALLSCAMYVLLRHLALFSGVVPEGFLRFLLLGLGLFSIFIALPFILVQHDLKRLLAYSSVENMGLIMVGIGLWTPLGIFGALLHLINHALAKSALFYLSGMVAQRYHSKDMLRIRALVRCAPAAGSLFFLLLLTITGVPPMGVFISKLTIVWSAFKSGEMLFGAVLLVLLTGVCIGLLYYGWQICFSHDNRTIEKKEFPPEGLAIIWLSFAAVFSLGIFLPSWLSGMLHQATRLVMGG